MNRETVSGYIRAQFDEATDEQVKAIVNSVMSDNGKDINRYKAQAEEAESELAELRVIKEEYEKYKQENMTESEKLQKSLEEAERIRTELNVKSNRMEVERMFVSNGIAEEDYAGILDSIVGENLNASKASAEQVISLLVKTREETDKAVRADVLKNTPVPQGNIEPGNSVTKEQFESMSYAERLEVFNESPELYKQMTQGD